MSEASATVAPSPPRAEAEGTSDRRVVWGVVAVIAATVAVHVWTVSGGSWTHWHTRGAYYQKLADAFRHGQLHLLDRPDPRLFSLADPYDPVQNGPYRLHDASLYGGKYYLYWGPMPALLVAAVNAVTPIRFVPDQVLAFAFTIGTIGMAALLLLHLWHRHFRDAPGWTVPLAVLAVGLATPAPFNLARAAVYEASITAAQMFFVAGLYFSVRALDRPAAPSRTRLLLAGICLACAVGSRASMALPVAGAAAWIGWRILRQTDGPGVRRRAFAAALMLALPIGAAAGALAAYNQARFGSPFELGIRYQLAGFNSRDAFENLTSVRYVIPNLRSYLVEPVPREHVWPFGRPPEPDGGSIAGGLVRLPSYAVGREAPAGILLVAPFAWLALATLRGRSGVAFTTDRGSDEFVAWLLSFLGISIVLLAVPALVLIDTSSSLRYQTDWTTTVLLVATVGFWQGHRRRASRPRARRVWLTLGATLALLTAAVGIMLAVTRTPGHFLR